MKTIVASSRLDWYSGGTRLEMDVDAVEINVLFERVQSLEKHLSSNKTACTFKCLLSSSNDTHTSNVPFAVRNVHVLFSAIKRHV